MWTLSIRQWGTNFSEILIKIQNIFIHVNASEKNKTPILGLNKFNTIQVVTGCVYCLILVWDLAASWSGGRVQDSGLGSRSSPEFNTLPVRLLVVPLSKALHAVLLLSTQEQSGYLWGQVCKPWRQVACERLYTPQGVEMDIQMDMEYKGPMTREGTCQSLQSSEPGCGLKTVTLLLLYKLIPREFCMINISSSKAQFQLA